MELNGTSKPRQFKNFLCTFKKKLKIHFIGFMQTLTYTHHLGNFTTSTVTENTTELLPTAAHEIFIAMLEVKESYLFQIATTTQQRALMVYR